MTNEDPYLYPRTKTLKNHFGIRNRSKLELTEREIVANRATQTIPTGDFDLAHLRAIHHHLFQDIYDWAGELRTVEIAKGAQQFQFRRYIEPGMADIHRRLTQSNFLRDQQPPAFAKAAAPIIGDINYVHPFREGNGRTQLFYLQQLCQQAGHPIDLTRLDPARWLAASIASHTGNYETMENEVYRALVR